MAHWVRLCFFLKARQTRNDAEKRERENQIVTGDHVVGGHFNIALSLNVSL
jgi:hypothetical protein